MVNEVVDEKRTRLQSLAACSIGGNSGAAWESRTGGRAKSGVRSVTARQIARSRLVRLACRLEGGTGE